MVMVRNIAAILVGLIGGGLAIALVEAAAHAHMKDETVFGAVVAGYGLGSAVGSLAGGRIAGRRITVAVPALLAILACINLASSPHPLWFVPTAATALILGWWISAAIVARRWGNARAGMEHT